MIRFRDFTAEEVKQISDGCGVMARGLNVPDFIFKARCEQHDVYFARGTGWAWDSHWFLPYSIIRWYLQGQFWLQKANCEFFYWMLVDAWSPRHQIIEKLAYTVLAKIYFFAVVVATLLPSTNSMTEWRTKEETIAYARKRWHK